jgi:hypothetical protein
MSARENHDAPDLLRRMFTVRNAALLFLTFSLITTIVSVGVTAVLAEVLKPKLGSEMGNLGQIFESVNATFSGLAFIALVVTFRLQYDELKLQRAELQNQHQAMDKSQGALRRSAEADIRALHMQLIKMSMDDEDLAAVWPQYMGPISPVRSKQNKYANLIIQHHRMLYELEHNAAEDIRGAIRYLFTSPLMRSYWQGRMIARQVMDITESAEFEFDAIVDAVYLETEPPEPPEPSRRRDQGAEVIDLDTRRNPGSEVA